MGFRLVPRNCLRTEGLVMKLSIAAASSLAILGSVAAFAADTSPARQALPLRDVVPYLEAHYRGEVIAIALDASGDKAAHYHVDMRYPETGTAKLDVDAATLQIVARSQPLAEDGWTSLAGAAAFATTYVRGQVVAAELDAVDGAMPHYDIDVRLETGDIARLKVDPKTRQLGWRTPPVVAD
jgi:uncharacterized membrane protein YkoI